MTDDSRLVVGVFDLPERADRAAAELLSGGWAVERVAVVTGAEGDVTAALTAHGVEEVLAVYYGAEVRAGRSLVTVRCGRGDVAPALAAFGRYGGSVQVPPEVRAGRC